MIRNTDVDGSGTRDGDTGLPKSSSSVVVDGRVASVKPAVPVPITMACRA